VNLTVSPQIKILALVGLLAALGLGASMFVLGGHSSSNKTQTISSTVARPAHTPTVARTTPAPTRTTSTTATKAPTTTKHAHHAVKPKGFRGNAVYAQLPVPLQWQLAHHKIVVVSLYNPSSDVDSISVAEAHAGAQDAGAGFLLVNVLDNKVAGILTALLPNGGLLPDPGVLIYKAPGDVVMRLDGFNDRDAVAQAATDAMQGEIEPTTDPTSTLSAPVTTPSEPVASPTPTDTTAG